MKKGSFSLMAKKKKSTASLYIRITIGAITIGLMWSAIEWVQFRGYLDVNHYSYKGYTHIKKPEYEALIHDITQKLPSEIKLTEIQDRIESHPYVKATRVSHRYPSTIQIEIVERQPIAVLNGEPMVFLDEECYVMPDLDNIADLRIPILSNYNPNPDLYPNGDRARSIKVQESIQLLKKIQKEYGSLYLNISEISLNTDDEFIIVLIDHPTKIRLGRNDIWSKLLVLREFEAAIQGKKVLTDYAYLDMRYNNQVIVKEKI